MASPSTADIDSFLRTQFDYIVIGGGTAGLVVANRLSEDPNVTVGILEAGLLVENDPLIDFPRNMAFNNGKPGYDWVSTSSPQSGAVGRTMPIFRGKIVGGSTALNYMAWDRGSKAEYDAWKAVSDPKHGWDWDSLLPFFRKVEDVVSVKDQAPGMSRSGADVVNPGVQGNDVIGTSGPVQVSYSSLHTDVIPPFVKAWNALGQPTNANPWGGDASGLYNVRRAIDSQTGKRVTATSAYYTPAASRRNLKLLTGAQVLKIVFKPELVNGQRVASKVEFSVQGKTFTASVGKEVILSAGTFNTPQILELSGIGNPKLLESMNIPTLVDLPGVGENYHDHPFTRIHYQAKHGTMTFDELRNNPEFAAAEKEKFEKSGQGWMATIDTTCVFTALDRITDKAVLSASITQLVEMLESSQPNGLAKAQHAIQLDWLREGNVPHVEFLLLSRGLVNPQPGESYFLVSAGLQHPFSRGSVHIQSADPLQQPVIDPGYLTNDFDMFSLAAAYRTMEKLAQTPPFSDIIEKPIRPTAILTDEEVILYIKEGLSSGGHHMGTAAMARRELGGVVGSDLKVHGTANVRVADASIVPVPLAAHVQATIYAIGEKAADIIKKDQA